jgi:hypothetical protein
VPQLAVQLGFAVVHLDLGWVEVRVGLEYESAQHAERGQFELDVRRNSELAARGWLIIVPPGDLPNGSRACWAGSAPLCERAVWPVDQGDLYGISGG